MKISVLDIHVENFVNLGLCVKFKHL